MISRLVEIAIREVRYGNRELLGLVLRDLARRHARVGGDLSVNVSNRPRRGDQKAHADE